MSLLTRIKLVCTDGDDIFINDGVYGGLMEFMQVPELQPPYRVIRDGEVLDGPTKPWKVFGPTCDPLDVLPHQARPAGSTSWTRTSSNSERWAPTASPPRRCSTAMAAIAVIVTVETVRSVPPGVASVQDVVLHGDGHGLGLVLARSLFMAFSV